MMVSDDITKVLELDNMCMVFVLHALSNKYSSVKDQALTNTTISIVEELIDRLIWVSLQSYDTHRSAPESCDFVSNFSNGKHSICVSGRGRGRGGRGNLCC